MAGRLAFVPKFGEWDNREAALSLLGRISSPPRNLYRDLIRSVAVSGGQYIRPHAHTGSSYSSPSGDSNSYHYPSNRSDCSSGSASGAGRAGFCGHDHELTKIARRMVGDGYARRMVNAFGSGGGLDRAALETWFLELDVDWVLQIHGEHDLQRQLQDKPASSLQELVERWIRALTVIAVSVTELVVTTDDDTPAVVQFGRASMANMLVFVDAIIPALKVEEGKLRALVDMYICVSSASYRLTPLFVSPQPQAILNEIGGSLSTEAARLREAIFCTMEEVRKIVEDDELWAIEIPRGRGEVHRNTRFMVDCIQCMVKAGCLTRNSAQQSHDTADLGGLMVDSLNHLKDLLLRKSKMCSDPSLRYLFLLNNFNLLAAQLSEPRLGDNWGLVTPECRKFMDSYLDVSWGHVVSHIRKMVFMDTCSDTSCGPVWFFCVPNKKTSSLAKFDSAFHKTYQAHKFLKVQDPQLRDVLRRSIAERVISDYRDYLEKHPELEKDVSSGPDVLKEMLGELFEG